MDSRFEVEWFHEAIASNLERALKNTIEKKKTRIILSIPPRHGKTDLTSKKFPAWALGKYPHLKFILSTYGAELSEKIGLGTRDIINQEEYKVIFPGITLRQDVKAKAKWAIAEQKPGGKVQYPGGSYTAVGIGGAVTGTGGDIIIMDDPHKDRAEAESKNIRDTVYEYYRSTLYSRLEGYGTVIVIMQRWHTDDLVGRLIEEEEKKRKEGGEYDEWEIIEFPAIADHDEEWNGKVVRKKGEALWPSKFPLDVLRNIKEVAGIYNWASQYQQNPIPTENQEFNEGMFQYYEPELLKGKYVSYHTIIDPAISQKKEADNTVILTIAKEVNGPNVYRVREDAGHFTPQQTIDLIFLHQAMYTSTVHLETIAYQLALKYSIIEQQKKNGRYFIVNEIKTSTNKEVKIRGLLPLYEARVIWHLRTDTEYEEELLTFPRGKRDDRIDTMAMSTMVMQNTGGRYASVVKKKIKGYFKN